jgi:hypothetical protein
LVEFVVGEGVEVGVVVAAVCLFDDWEGLADEWFGVAGVVWERVDESLAAAGGAVGVGVVAGPAEVAAVGAGAGEGLECVFEPADAAVLSTELRGLRRRVAPRSSVRQKPGGRAALVSRGSRTMARVSSSVGVN